MLFIPWNFPLHEDSSIVGSSNKAETDFKLKYPVVYSHLERFKLKLSSRNKAEIGIRYEWYALQRWAASYQHEFRKLKFIYQDIAINMPFYYDNSDHFFFNNTCWMMTGKPNALSYLTAIFNSSLFPAVIAAFLEELINACVMEVYFPDHMAEKSLSVIAEVRQAIKPLPNMDSENARWQQIQSFYDTVNAPKHPVRNRLMRIPIDSPDLLRVIKKEGKV